MYTYEDRLRAMQPYIKLGKSIGLTIRQLGYPTKKALKTWYREYERSHELRAGYRRIHASLIDQCVNVSEKVARRLMKQERLVAASSTCRRYGAYTGEISAAPDNVLNQDFSAGAPNENWLTDITES